MIDFGSRDRVAGFRLLHLLPGIGSATAQRVLDRMAEAADPIGALAGIPTPPRAGAHWTAFVETLGNLRYSEWPVDLELARLRYEPHLDRIHEDPEMRRADLLQLEQIASGYPSRERFLTELTLDPPDATSDQAGVPLLDEDYLILSTIHSAKGQEWKSVYLLNVVDGCMPSDLGAGTSAEIEEERRLLYVAMTAQRMTCIWSCPSASSSTANTRRAIAISMHQGHDSFRKNYSICSSGRLGQLCLPAARHAPPARDPRWISAPACGECGDRRIGIRDALRGHNF